MADYGNAKWTLNFKYRDQESNYSSNLSGMNLLNDWGETPSSLGYTSDNAYTFAQALVSLAGSTWQSDVTISETRTVTPV